jgi:hypothetical protein
LLLVGLGQQLGWAPLLRIRPGIFDSEPDLGLKSGQNIQKHPARPKLLNCEIAQPTQLPHLAFGHEQHFLILVLAVLVFSHPLGSCRFPRLPAFFSGASAQLSRIRPEIFDFEPELHLKLGQTKPKISGTVPTNRHTTFPNDSGPISAFRRRSETFKL